MECIVGGKTVKIRPGGLLVDDFSDSDMVVDSSDIFFLQCKQ